MRNEEDVIKLINNKFPDCQAKILRPQNIEAKVSEDIAIDVLNYLKSHGYTHLALISCVDWINNNQFEIVYNIFSYEDRINISIQTRIDREKAKYVTAKELWPVARFYERDIHDFFGVEFEGNDDMEELFLENWHNIPPMRKDFDTRKFVNEQYEWRNYHEQENAD
jgi:NADH-quinone oxidoreductase subunit C